MKVTLRIALSRRYARELQGSTSTEALAGLAEQIKREVGFTTEDVSFRLDARSERASVDTLGDGAYTIHLPTLPLIRKRMPELSEREVRAKRVSQVCEEAAHVKAHETAHTKKVVKLSLKCFKRHLSKSDMQLPIMREKVEILTEASRKRHPPE